MENVVFEFTLQRNVKKPFNYLYILLIRKQLNTLMVKTICIAFKLSTLCDDLRAVSGLLGY